VPQQFLTDTRAVTLGEKFRVGSRVRSGGYFHTACLCEGQKLNGCAGHERQEYPEPPAVVLEFCLQWGWGLSSGKNVYYAAVGFTVNVRVQQYTYCTFVLSYIFRATFIATCTLYFRKYFRTFVQRYSRQGYTYCTRVHVSMCTTYEGVQYVVARTSCVDLITKRLRVRVRVRVRVTDDLEIFLKKW